MTSVINTQLGQKRLDLTGQPCHKVVVCVCVCRETRQCCWTHTCSKLVWRFIWYVYNMSEEIWAHLSSHLSGWSCMEQDCTSGDVQGEQIKGYQRNPVIARQLIVSPGTKQRHFFCLLIRLRSCGLLSRCVVSWRKRLQQHPLGEGFLAALSHSRATRNCIHCTFP